jgi:uncharacterized protein
MDSRQFVVPIHDLDVSGRSVTFTLPLAWLREALQDCEIQPAGPDAVARLDVSKTGQDVLVRGGIEVEFVVPCARCLAPVRFRPDVQLSLVLEPAAGQERLPSNVRRLHKTGGASGASASGAGRTRGRPTKPTGHPPDPDPELFENEADRDTYEGDEVVLDRFFREALLLESPIFPLCSETCEGIRPT